MANTKRPRATALRTKAQSTLRGESQRESRFSGPSTPATSLRQLLRAGKETGHVDGALLLGSLPDHILESPQKLDEVVALFKRHSVAIKDWSPPCERGRRLRGVPLQRSGPGLPA
jgi:hypothetical protein